MTKILFAIVALLFCLSVYLDLSVAFWGDQDWELLVSGMWLAGKKLYVDHIPVTGPLLFYLYAVPVWLSQHLTFLQDYQALVLVTLCVIAGVIFLSTRLIVQHPGFAERNRQIQWVLLLCFLLVIRIRPIYFGDREHIMIMMTLPYLLRWMPGLSNGTYSLRMRLLIGAMAAVGFCIKPHCLLLFAGIQLAHVLYRRTLKIFYSPENITIYVLSILYVLMVWIYTPEYITTVLPLAFFTYSAIKGGNPGLINVVVSAVLTFIMLRPGNASVYRKDIYYFAALLPFLALYIYTNNGWVYTFQPMMTILLLISAFLLWDFQLQHPGLTRSGWQPMLGIVFCTLNFVMETAFAGNNFVQVQGLSCLGNSECQGYFQPLTREIEINHAHSFGAIGIDFYTWARVSKLSGAVWVTRFPQLWMLPKFLIAGKEFYTQHKGIYYYVAGALAEDLEEKKPDLIFVERPDQIYTILLSRTLDWMGILTAVPSFNHALSHYRLVHTVDACSHLLPASEAVAGPPVIVAGKPKVFNCRYDIYQRLP